MFDFARFATGTVTIYSDVSAGLTPKQTQEMYELIDRELVVARERVMLKLKFITKGGEFRSIVKVS